MANTRFSSAVHMLVSLATAEEAESLTSEQLGERLESHPVVVRRLISELRDAGFISALRGVGGGVRLAKQPADIRLGAVARTVEFEPAFDIHDLPAVDPHPLDAHVVATLAVVQKEATRGIMTHLDTVTLADIVDGATLRSDLADLLGQGLTDAEIRASYRVAGGRMVPVADRKP